MDQITCSLDARNGQSDLFGTEPPHYPFAPGSKAAGTSRDAARKISLTAGTLRADVLGKYAAQHPAGMTADEAADAVGRSILSIRPRVSELLRAGLLEMTPMRRPNESGLAAHVLRASPAALAERG